MSLATSYRYEAMVENKGLKNAVRRQEERIRIDEMMASKQQQAKIEANINLRSEWNESMEHMAGVKQAKSNARQTQIDLRMARKASLMVRQAALRQFLENEWKEFEKELHQQGKAFYIQRT